MASRGPFLSNFFCQQAEKYILVGTLASALQTGCRQLTGGGTTLYTKRVSS
jgi:hypothetical protein